MSQEEEQQEQQQQEQLFHLKTAMLAVKMLLQTTIFHSSAKKVKKYLN